MNQENADSRNAIASFGLALLAAVGLTGCTGLQPPSEKQARHQVETELSRPLPGRPSLEGMTPRTELSAYLKLAATHQPNVAAAYYDWLAAVERISQARSLPDPKLTFQMDVGNLIEAIMPGVMFDFPGAGKLRAQAEVASAEAQAKYEAFRLAVAQSAYNVQQPLIQLRLLDEKLLLTRQSCELMAETEQAARAQNQSGSAALAEVLRAQMERDRLESELGSLEDARQPLLAQYKAAFGLGLTDPAPPVPAPLTIAGQAVDEKQLKEAWRRNPRFRILEAEIQQAEAAIRLAQKNANPDYTVGLEADLKAAPAMWRPQAGMTLPIWRDKIAARIAEAQAGKSAAQARLAAEQIDLAVEFATTWFTWREARRSLELNGQKLQPKARQAWLAARAAYAAGQADFSSLLDAERALLAIQWSEAEARSQRDLALLDMSLLLAGKVPGKAASMPGGASSPGNPPAAASSNGKAKKM
jgi:outer membrane protein, heavy metal efflux system